MFDKVTIIGVGLIGGSVGLAIKKNKLARKVVGLSHRQASLTKAQSLGAIDEGFTEVAAAVRGADLVIIATPVEWIIKMFPQINTHLKKNCIITDVGGTKVEIIAAAQNALANPVNFVGSHPLAGSEKKGVEFASVDLFQNALCIMTPLKTTHQSAREKVKTLWTKMGCRVKLMTPEEHDEILGFVSHMPHIVAYSMVESIPESFLLYAPKGLKDTTRIAASDPELWKDVCLTNSRYVIKSIDAVTKSLSQIRKAIIDREDKTLLDHFTKSKAKRESFPESAA
ncbi:MAG: prephenate dehydrogenase/arogenate dehydrogenase family protein [Sedimentisphaerales bacterium]|nr:prephenate dehydrogenase/arogenate dehydrogenase family protein [Sedimentisphaerales bacterium]